MVARITSPDVYMNAQEARKLSVRAEEVESGYALTETLAVLHQVEKAAKSAKRSCAVDISWSHHDVIEKRLRELGYTVKYERGDQRDPGYHLVSW